MEKERDIRLTVSVLPGMLKAIDDWRLAKRLPNRIAAIRELLLKGCAQAAEAEPRFSGLLPY
jgi:hypothetical protein